MDNLFVEYNYRNIDRLFRLFKYTGSVCRVNIGIKILIMTPHDLHPLQEFLFASPALS